MIDRRDADDRHPGRWISALLLGALAAAAPFPAAAAPRELVVAHEILAEAGDHLDENLTALVRRVEEVAGWPKGSLKGKAFSKPQEALGYIKKNRSAFAILPAHQFVEGQKELKLEVLGRAVGLDGSPLVFSMVTRRPRPFAELAGTPGLRIAVTETYDPIWIKILSEGAIDKGVAPVALVPVPSAKVGIEELLAKKVDLVIVPELDYQALKPRIEPSGDLEWISSSPHIPPSAFLAVGKHVSPADKKKMSAAVDKICKTSGGPACSRMGILYIEANRAESYQGLLELYQSLKPTPR